VKDNKNVSGLLCPGCGVCPVVCPEQAITIATDRRGNFFPVVNEALCRGCANCIKVCPGYHNDWDSLNRSLFAELPQDAFLGNFLKCYKGHAQDEQLRFQASSGGAVTSLLCGLLKTGRIQGAMVTRIGPGNDNLAECFLATSPEEILGAKTSKYQMAPMDSALRRLRSFPGNVAVVGLPCQVMALRKAAAIDGVFKEKIVAFFSLFCGKCPTKLATVYFFKRAKVDPSRLSYFTYRGDGWPGKTVVRTVDGRQRIFTHLETWESIFGLDIFTPLACLCCYDFFGEFSDISFGSDWLSECEPGQDGESLLLTRTGSGTEILQQAVTEGRLATEEIAAGLLKIKYAAQLIMHKNHYYLYRKWLKKCPQIDRAGSRPILSVWDYVIGMTRLITVQAGRIKPLRAVFLYLHSTIAGKIARKINRFLIAKMVGKQRNI
jgi:coenzyme F420 hydrogenase subunit beta